MPEPTPPSEMPVAGVRALDHTADVGLEVRAPDFERLLERAILGMDRLLREAPSPPATEERPLQVQAANAPALLRAVLQEVLYWHEVEGFAPVGLRVASLSETTVDALVDGGRPAGAPAREIKGVTWHGLAAEVTPDGWRATVIFDV